MATCTICNVLHGWSRGQKNEQQNNAPNPKKTMNQRLSGKVKIELLKRKAPDVGVTVVTDDQGELDQSPVNLYPCAVR